MNIAACWKHPLLLSTVLAGSCFAVSGCNSQTASTMDRQAGQNSCQLVDSGYGPTGTDQVHFETVANHLETPWDLAFLPGGDILVTERPGRIRLIHGGTLTDQPVAQINVTQSGEGGLLGIALHPQFATNSLFYVYETVTKNGTLVNRVERYLLSSDHTSATLDRIIIDDIEAGSIHNGGRLRFGPDGMLYIGTGNAGNTDLSQDANSLNGKVLRLTPDGAIPSDNPQAGKAWYLNGVRNSQGFDWIDNQTLVVADHGPTGEYQGRIGGDEVNIAHAGDNLGWPTIWHCETQAGLLTPILSWVAAVPPAGLAIYRGDKIPGWNGNVILGTLGSEHLHRIVLDSNHNVAKHEVYFQGAEGRLRDVIDGPDGYLYVTTSNCDSRGSCPADGDSILKLAPGAASSASSSVATRAQDTTSDLELLSVQGQVGFQGGTPLTQQPVTLTFTASGTGLFDQPADSSCRSDEHMQGVEALPTSTGDQGDFAMQLILSDFESRVNASCHLQKGLTDFDSLTVEASTDTNTDTCSAYCTGLTNPPDPSCVSKCLTGKRKLEGTKTFSHAELLQIASGNPASLKVPLTFTELGPPLSTLHGPDLAVDGKAAQDSAQISTETFAATDCAVVEGCLSGPGTHKLLRFDGVIQNLGDSDFVLGSPENNPLFTYSACHNHYHLKDIMLYELLDSQTKKPITVNGNAVVGRKQGFCMLDNEQIAGDAEGKFDCENQGVSPGWSDNYDRSLDCQWIDVTGVPAGKYILRITVNPTGRYSESDTSNNSSDVPVTIE
jgi:glucose/arabinose dehydrogenase